MKGCRSTALTGEKYIDNYLAQQWNSNYWNKVITDIKVLQILIAKATKATFQKVSELHERTAAKSQASL